MKKAILILIFLFGISNYTYSESHHKVKINLGKEVNNITVTNFCSDILDFKKDLFVIAILDNKELERLKSEKIDFEILEENIEENYSKICKLNLEKSNDNMQYPSFFNFGSMGGYYKFEEIYPLFDEMSAKYSQYFVQDEVIGKSIENRDIKCYIFGNQDLDKPKVQINSLIHAREGGGLTAIAYFMWDLLEKAKNGDKEAQFILNNREIYIIPVINPDGLVYNQTINPSGGGMWRKNRKKINDSTYGVDLNRNFGPYEYWNSSNLGSSDVPSDVTYRGTAPFSEPETKALENYALINDFKTALCFHTYSNDLIYSYSALPGETADSNLLRGMAIEMSKNNKYVFGTDQFTVGYGTRGSSDDWFYYTDSLKKYKTLAITPEVGNLQDGFWTTKERILDQCKENIDVIENIIWSAGANIKPIDLKVFNRFEKDFATLNLMIQNIGVEDYFEKVNVWVNSLDDIYKYNSPALSLPYAFSSDINRLSIDLPQPDQNFINGSKVKFEVIIEQDKVMRRDTFEVQMYYYKSIPLFANGLLVGNWDQEKWGFQYDTLAGQFLLCDSPDALYELDQTNIITMKDGVLIDKPSVLAFTAYWQIETNYDFGKIEVSDDGGTTWQNVGSSRMHPGSGIPYGKQKNMDEYGFNGYYPILVDQYIDLNQFLGKTISIRMSVATDKGSNYDGVFFKSIEIRQYENTVFTNIEEVPNLVDKVSLKAQNENSCLLNTTFDLNVDSKIEIHNLLGEQILAENKLFDRNHISVDLSNLSNGVYFIKVKSGLNNGFVKIVK